MRRASNFVVILLTFLLLTEFAFAGRIDRDSVWFGVEYTFQDQEMVNEPGRNTTSTPHKEAKAQAIAKGLAIELGLPASAVTKKETWKPGWFLNVPGDGQWVINSEPVTIEVNTSPKTVDQIVEVARPIFKVTEANGLVAHVNPAAERSGMGHVHVGAESMATNPFFLNPLLLRNVMVYVHKNPALMHGFAEAFDIGRDSNIETYHEEGRQKLFEMAIAAFDAWYDMASPAERKKNGFNQFLKTLAAHDYGGGTFAGFFEHYRLINLQHVRSADFTPETTGKKTVEFRGFRPPKSPEVAKAFAELLLAMMEFQSRPKHREPFKWVSHDEYLRFNAATRVQSNWEEVRRDLKLNDKLLDAEIAEYADAVQRCKYRIELPGAEVFRAYSRKGEKGEYFEIRIDASKAGETPSLVIGRKNVSLELVTLEGKSYWIGIIDAKALKVSPKDVEQGRTTIRYKKVAPQVCPSIFKRAA